MAAWLTAGMIAVAPPPAAGQTPPNPLQALLADPLIPAGRLSVDFAPSYARWNSRYGRYDENGAVVDGKEPLGKDLTDPTTSGLFPGLAELQESIRALASDPDYSNVLGSTAANVTQEMTRIDMGLRVGVFDWLTLGVMVPYVKGRTALQVGFVPDSAANLGLNPRTSDPSTVDAFLAGLDDVATAADAQAQVLCTQAQDPACDRARSLADRTLAFLNTARTAYAASPFFPTGTSAAGEHLQTALSSLNAALDSAKLPTVAASMAFAAGALNSEDLASVPKDRLIQGAPLTGAGDALWTLGDVEISGTVRLLEGEVRDSGAVAPRYAWMLTGGGLVRLATGTLDDPAVAYDLSSGDGQMDLEGRVDGALRVGSRLDLRATARYGVQRSRVVLRRVARHENVFPAYSSIRAVTWAPGRYQAFVLSPRVHLGEALSLTLDVQGFHKGEDSYALVSVDPDRTAPVDVADLERETAMTLLQLGVGLRYSTLALARRGLSNTPLDLGVRLVRSLSGSGGNVPVTTRAEFSVSLTRRIWGNN